MRAEGWGRSFQSCAGGGHSKFTDSMAGWNMGTQVGLVEGSRAKAGEPNAKWSQAVCF